MADEGRILSCDEFYCSSLVSRSIFYSSTSSVVVSVSSFAKCAISNRACQDHFTVLVILQM
ncbi:unnamed protein product [Acanthoscelides obtectus]|uniref:Uncharacterized protein n=1 Tax=Acanthoscelides obtectus TaxID=200917 RepID=A0A9P0KEE3_ACAOB|nr:unnamed protein product [Acanthoscelides obtectus]CAK1633493.1 hypothetical protein AOBTE_LOCUS8172 [Acanthoscelides obtectus]